MSDLPHIKGTLRPHLWICVERIYRATTRLYHAQAGREKCSSSWLIAQKIHNSWLYLAGSI